MKARDLPNKPKWIWDTLQNHYGDKGWWPGQPYEIIISAILVQNTAWSNVEKSLAGFGTKLSPEFIENLTKAELIERIRPSGSYNAKALCIKAVTVWYKAYEYSAVRVSSEPQEKIRKELLGIKGIGKETADAIMLYAFLFPVFVVDAYLKRLCMRLGVTEENDYRKLQQYFEKSLEKDAVLLGKYHILILEHCKTCCKKKPICPGCPFFEDCLYPDKV